MSNNNSNLDPQHKAFISQAISKILSDPDLGKSLSDEAKKRLEQARKENDEDLVSLERLEENKQTKPHA